MDPRVYWVGWNLVKGIGAVRFQALLDYFGDAQSAWEASPDALKSAGIHSKIVDHFLQIRHSVDLEKIWGKIFDLGAEVLTWDDERYPRRLKDIDQPPPVLYLHGTLQAEDEWAVAIVGSRRITAYGRQVAEELADFLARNGVTVVSGLARGVDAVAHRAALQAGGRTLAILGSGLDRIYPPEHRQLAAEVSASGALISDYPLGTPPEGVNFPPRNRIISGLSLAVVIVEAGETSGALITASFAAEQGREVFAVPGNIFAPQCKGTNRLIQQGARPLLQYEDVLEVLNLQQIQEYRQARLLLPENEIEARLIDLLGTESLHIDEICNQSGLPVEQVSATLALMELKGMVRQMGGMSYMAVRESRLDYRTETNA